jgi:response regulator RpfG family c-di-GMP phosphodiesterase
MPRVLVAEPDGWDRSRIVDDLAARGYQVIEAASGEDAVARLRTEHFAVLLCDRWSDAENGFEIVPKALELDPDLAIVLLSEVTDVPSAAELLSSGAYDYLRKPAEPRVVGKAVERAFHRRRRELERRHVERAVRESVMMRTVQVEKEKDVLRGMSLDIVHSLVAVLEQKDPFLHGHSDRVASLCARIAEQMRLGSEMIESVRLAGRLHDVGMVGIPDHILRKTGPLTAEEYSVVRKHVEIGMTLLAPVAFIGETLTFVRDHHEHVDGSGYPRGLVGEEISLGGRIVAAADAYDALTSTRIFRPAHSSAHALEILGRKAGRHLDANVYRALACVTGQLRGFMMV